MIYRRWNDEMVTTGKEIEKEYNLPLYRASALKGTYQKGIWKEGITHFKLNKKEIGEFSSLYPDAEVNSNISALILYTTKGVDLIRKKIGNRDHCTVFQPKIMLVDKKQSTSEEVIPYREIIDYLNLKTNREYKADTNAHKKFIRARWNEGFRLEQFKKVIDCKAADWLGNEEMSKYLRPETLFGNKFESYLNQRKPRNNFDELLNIARNYYLKEKAKREYYEKRVNELEKVIENFINELKKTDAPTSDPK